MLAAAQSVIALREQSLQPSDEETEGAEQMAQNAASIESDPTAPPVDVEPNEKMIAAGYDEAVENGVPSIAEKTIRAEDSADPVALTEADPMTVDELVLQEAGRDLRPDVITQDPDAPVGVDLDKVRAAAEEESATAEESFAPSPDELAATDETEEEEKP
jgi:hypothetical protein